MNARAPFAGFLCWFLFAIVASASDFDVRDFGAKGDGKTIDSDAINAAIAAAAEAGGGTVRFPAGTFASYSIRLKSNVSLHLDAGATILAAEPAADGSAGYDPPEPNPGWDRYQDFGHSHWRNSLIWGEDLENVSIVGTGRIFGRGLSWGHGHAVRHPSREERAKGVEVPSLRHEAPEKIAPGPFNYPNRRDSLPPGIGNKAIALKNCRNVILRDFTILHGGHFGILATGVDNLTIDNLTIDTNRDGIDIDACRNVRISNCAVNAQEDDAICLKSSLGLGYPRATENVMIVNCLVSGYDEGSLLDGTRTRTEKINDGAFGRIKLGTESNGGFRNITIANCVFDYSRGLALETVDGGDMENIVVTNLVMRDVPNAPIFIRQGARLRGPEGTKPGVTRGITISNIIAQNVAADAGILIAGLESAPIEDVSLSDISITCAGGGMAEQARRVVPEYEDDYPEPGSFGVLPSWALWARHVRNLEVRNFESRTIDEDRRPAVILDNVAGASLDRVKTPAVEDRPNLVMDRVSGIEVTASPALTD